MEQWGRNEGGIGGVDHQTACLRLPQFPLQLLLQQKPQWRGEKVVWLKELKADAKVCYLTPQAAAAGVKLGARYATVLGVVPDLLAGTCSEDELKAADYTLLEILRRFSPQIRRRSQHVEQGLYLLDATGLERAFKGMASWASGLVRQCRLAGWQVRVAVGFTPFATEMATYHLQEERPIRLFQNRREEESKTMQTPLSAFSLSPDKISQLRRFQILTLGHFLALEAEEVKKRFGGDLLEFYQKAAGAIFAAFPPLPEPESLKSEMGFSQPVSDLRILLQASTKILLSLIHI